MATVLALGPACQVLFGDYKVDSSSLGIRVCEADEYRCVGETLEVCAPNRTHFQIYAVCASADQCNLNSASCRPCQAGVEHQCAGATLFSCNADARWEMLKTCPSPALCSAAAGDCLPAACAVPGEHQCAMAALQRCSVDQTTWEKVADCASAADCNQSEANAQAAAGEPVSCTVTCTRGEGACSAPTCETPGSFRCLRDLSLQRCSETFQWQLVKLCDTFALCNANEGRCEPVACRTDERRCTGNTVEQCKGDRTGWTTVRNCATGQLCDPAAAKDDECVPGPCSEGATRCNSLFVEQCRGGVWERSQRCAAACDPATKTCPS
jgi:hypothetical protein